MPIEVFGSNGADFINDNDGNDSIIGGNGIDTVDGGAGNDAVSGSQIVLAGLAPAAITDVDFVF